MALVLNEEQTLLRDSARNFLAAEAPVAHLRMLRDTTDPTGFSRDVWRRCTEMGFAGVLIDEAHGGLGLGMAETVVIAEELGRTLTPSPFLSTAVLAASLIGHGSNAALKRRGLPSIAAGEAVIALALDEHARHRPDAIALEAQADGDGLVLHGCKLFVLDGHVADLLLVVARMVRSTSDGDGLTVLAVDPKTAGVTIERTVMVDGHNAARITFDGVRVAHDAALATPSEARAMLDDALDRGRLVIAAQLLGAGEAAFARTLDYLKERQQFGRKIGEFQALQHRAAHLYCELELARAAVMRAVDALEMTASGNRRPAGAGAQDVSAAKAKACAAAGLAVQEGVQMHGGMGMTDAYDIGFFMKRVRVLQECLGDASFHEARFARLNGY